MPYYRKKPVVIEAVQFTGHNHEEIERFCGRNDLGSSRAQISRAGNIMIETLEGVMMSMPDDFIIKGVQGEFYPVKPDIFEATYVPVESA